MLRKCRPKKLLQRIFASYLQKSFNYVGKVMLKSTQVTRMPWHDGLCLSLYNLSSLYFIIRQELSRYRKFYSRIGLESWQNSYLSNSIVLFTKFLRLLATCTIGYSMIWIIKHIIFWYCDFFVHLGVGIMFICGKGDVNVFIF